ncbi:MULTISPECIES: 2Fe-2S iron-sulfur cluster-binding protein [unclassified Sphingomonas]|uniref:2Fe-2S iron-sulfur cluster-binding protein n=1 Tax=unclassified Sphingomonas TaxID=196159 RepID=UPI001D0F7CC7|nr:MULTISPECIES: 2Fe-2S iron-sulfur cluster-binding protein [unclassified Sphingomonas]MCC2981236.1 2Fe-2S iron-sulfur cluster-binding protein [Sphingomonas sp. IC4-52]MCD2316947.1 2Fe-2S iron-sulfur cluster-binding protein [Sphingomonas sp. IC-11]
MKVRFEAPDGSVVEADASPGQRLLEVGQRVGMPLEGTCEGQMACATCHVIVAPDDFTRLPKATEEEEDMLDLAPNAARTSRLSCQIVLKSEHNGLTVRIP